MSSGGVCAGCGGLLGRDCWNEADCVWISQDMAMRSAAPPQPEPCQGCSIITGGYVPCADLCAGATSWADVEARAAVYATIPTTTAAEHLTNPTESEA